MYSRQLLRSIRQLLPAILVVSLSLFNCCPSVLADGVAPATVVNTAASGATRTANDYPLATSDEADATPKKGEIFQFKPGPILNRKPLMMIHGGEGENKHLFRWDKVVDRFIAEPGFEATFKMYLFRYDSKARLAETVPELKAMLKELYEKTGKPITVLALSMGGNVIQAAMADPQVSKMVEMVIALGTPFHGSPLFSQNWFQYSLDKSWILPFAQAVHNIDYKFYFARHKNYLADLKWDNLDGLIPDIGHFKAAFPGGPKGDLTVESDANPHLKELNTSGAIDKSKFITYGGYIYNPYLMPPWRRKLENTVFAPYYYFTVRLPMHIGKTRPALKLLNREMSRMYAQGTEGKVVSHAYKLNDGITPVKSALFLPAETLSKYKEIGEKDLPQIGKEADVKVARVFKNIDHVAFLDGGPGKGKSTPVIDEMHPEEGARPILDWIVYDLLRTEAPSQVARSTDKPN